MVSLSIIPLSICCWAVFPANNLLTNSLLTNNDPDSCFFVLSLWLDLFCLHSQNYTKWWRKREIQRNTKLWTFQKCGFVWAAGAWAEILMDCVVYTAASARVLKWEPVFQYQFFSASFPIPVLQWQFFSTSFSVPVFQYQFSSTCLQYQYHFFSAKHISGEMLCGLCTLQQQQEWWNRSQLSRPACAACWGDLLRSVPHIKTDVKIN